MLEGTTVNITDKSGSAGGRRTGMPGSLGSSNSSGPGLGGNKGETYAVDTSNILFILSGAFVGLEKIVQDRLAKGVSLQRQQGDIQLYLYALSLLVSMLLCDLHQMISMSMRKKPKPILFLLSSQQVCPLSYIANSGDTNDYYRSCQIWIDTRIRWSVTRGSISQQSKRPGSGASDDRA